MSRYTSTTTTAAPAADSGRPTSETVREQVHNLLTRYLAHMEQRDMPAPFPPNIPDAVRWWIKTMQQPEQWHEKPQTVSVLGHGDAVRWEYAYANRVLANLRHFLRLSLDDRKMIVAGREDGVYWRGESVPFFIAVVNEHQRMKESGLPEYIKSHSAALAKLRRDERRKARQ